MENEVAIWLYIIRGSNGKYYTGITNDLDRRIKEHRNGTSRSTRKYGSIELVWVKVFTGRQEAREWEVRIKKKGAARWLKTYADVNKENWLKEKGKKSSQ